MPRLVWNAVGTRYYEAGVDRGVLYVGTDPGVAWIGLTSVSENPTGAEPKPYYQDGVKYSNTTTSEEFEATISAYTYPREFEPCDGSISARSGLILNQQPRRSFGLCYRTMIGNDLDNNDQDYKLHLIYNARARPTGRTNNTLNESPDPTDFSWSITTRPPAMSGYKRTAHIVVDSRYTNADVLATLEDSLYGSDMNTPTLPTLDELLAIFDSGIVFTVTDNGDGTFTIEGSDSAVAAVDADTYTITWPTVLSTGTDQYTISS